MSERAVETCANCGALLDVVDGKCKFCGAVFTQPAPEPEALRLAASAGRPDNLLGGGGVGLPLPASGLLSCLSLISRDANVQAFLAEGQMDAAQRLVAAVKAAGERAGDAGLGDFDQQPEAFQPAELWLFELARDLLAQLSGIDGVDHRWVRQARQIVEDVCKPVWQKPFDAAAKQLGAPPDGLAALRETVPRLSPPAAEPAAEESPAEEPQEQAPRKKHFWNKGGMK